MVHDHVLDRWHCLLTIDFVLDDARHTFGSVQHSTLKHILQILGLVPHLVSILMAAAMQAVLHMERDRGIQEAFAKFRVSIVQGCPLSALHLCLVLQLQIHMVTQGLTIRRNECGRLIHADTSCAPMAASGYTTPQHAKKGQWPIQHWEQCLLAPHIPTSHPLDPIFSRNSQRPAILCHGRLQIPNREVRGVHCSGIV